MSVVSVCASLALACASVSIQRLEPTALAATAPAHIEMLGDFPADGYRAVARIEVRDRGLGRSVATLRQKLVDRAAELGADAVVLEPTSTRRSVGGSPGPVGLYDDALVAGTAIIYYAPGAPEDT